MVFQDLFTGLVVFFSLYVFNHVIFAYMEKDLSFNPSEVSFLLWMAPFSSFSHQVVPQPS